MQKQWTGKNVDLKQLSQRIEEFFIEKGLATKNKHLQDKYKISVFMLTNDRRSSRMDVHIFGSSDDFLIETIASERMYRSMMLGFITSMIGGGNLVLRSVKLEEALRELERDFWIQIEDIIASLASSSQTA